MLQGLLGNIDAIWHHRTWSTDHTKPFLDQTLTKFCDAIELNLIPYQKFGIVYSGFLILS